MLINRSKVYTSFPLSLALKTLYNEVFEDKKKVDIDKRIKNLDNQEIEETKIATINDIDVGKYLYYLITIENNIDYLTKHLKKVASEEIVFPRNYIREIGKKNKMKRDDINSKIDSLNIEIKAIGKNNSFNSKILKLMDEKSKLYAKETNIIFNKFSILPPIKHYEKIIIPKEEPSMPKKPVLKTPAFLYKKYNNNLLKNYENEKLKYENALKEYNEKIESYKEKCSEYKKEYKEYEEKVDKLIKKEIIKIDQEKEKEEYELQKRNHIKEDELKRQLSTLNEEKEILESKNFDRDRLLSQSSTWNFYQEEIKTLEQELKENIKVKKQLLSLNVVYPKYLDIVALTTMYEYFETGRVSSLKGADGAYNLYESEVRTGIIISKLDTIINQLEQIKANQYMLYNSLESINRNLKNIESKMVSAISVLENIDKGIQNANEELQDINKNTVVAAYSQEKIAQYTKRNTELTNAIKFITLLK